MDDGSVEIEQFSDYSNPRGRFFGVPCLKCIGCKQDRSRGWSIRIQHEAKLYESNCIVTLTYDDVHLPEGKRLVYRDFQLFVKRLRKAKRGADGRRPIRFFVAGEYGAVTRRPHWHAVLFNTRFEDAVPWMSGYATSSQLEKLWDQSEVVQLDPGVTPEGASYVSGYVNAKAYGAAAVAKYERVCRESGEVFSVLPEFARMSNGGVGGLGAEWFERFRSDFFPADRVVQDGKEWKVPRYYFDRYKRTASAFDVEAILLGREARAREQLLESTPERRRAREAVAFARLSHFNSRGL